MRPGVTPITADDAVRLSSAGGAAQERDRRCWGELPSPFCFSGPWWRLWASRSLRLLHSRFLTILANAASDPVMWGGL